MKNQKPISQPSTFIQFVVNFLIPIVILTRFSGNSQLGPTKSLLLALAFPIGFEIYNVRKRKKVSLISLLAIGGILVTGAISLLGLDEGWLAVRRSVPYLAVSMVILISIGIKRPLLSVLLAQVFDMEKINARAQKRQTYTKLQKQVSIAGFLMSGVLFVIAGASYILTRVVIVSETGTTGFNQEYAQLRILSLVVISLPLIVGLTGVILYLMKRIEKLTGLDIDSLMKKK